MKPLLTFFFSFILVQSAIAQATEQNTTYFTADDMPNMINFLPAPPDSTQKAALDYDVERYKWGKQQRSDSIRANVAKNDIDNSFVYFCKIFSQQMHLTLSPDSTPDIYKLLAKSIPTSRLIANKPKAHYKRLRPFEFYREHSLDPSYDSYMLGTGSYPSGHTIRGWAVALILSEICPEYADAILLRGYQYGESRVIVGAHWQSDIQAGFIAASAAVAKMHSSPEFLKDMQKAKDEYRRLRKESYTFSTP